MLIDRKAATILLTPACLLLAALTLLPAVGVLVISFVRWTETSPPAFGGLANFRALMADESFWNAASISLLFVALASGIELLVGGVVAVSLENWPRLRSAFRLLFALPLVLSPVIVGIVWRLALNEQTGLYTTAVRTITNWSPQPLSSPVGAVLTITLIDIWQWTALTALLMSIALESAHGSVGQLAKVDGISGLTGIRHVWAPLILPTVTAVGMLRLVDCLRVFDIVQTATAGGPGGSSEVLSLYTYRQLVKFGNFGKAAAAAAILLASSTILALFASRVFFRYRRRGEQ